MSSTAVVSNAQDMARRLVASESHGPGDTDMMASVYFRLVAAYEAECARQMRLYEHERTITKAKATGFAAHLVRAADALAGKTSD